MEVESRPYNCTRCRMFRHTIERCYIANPNLRKLRDINNLNQEKNIGMEGNQGVEVTNPHGDFVRQQQVESQEVGLQEGVDVVPNNNTLEVLNQHLVGEENQDARGKQCS